MRWTMHIIRQLGYGILACNVRMGSSLIKSIHAHKLLQCFQIADKLTIPVNPGYAAFLKRLTPVMIGVILIECLDLWRGSVKR